MHARNSTPAAGGRDPVHVEQPPQLVRVRRRLRDPAERVLGILRRRVVVEERERPLRLLRELLQRRHPLLELLVGVEVVEALRRRAAALVPRAEVAAVEADVRRCRRDGGNGRHEVLRGVRLRRVDGHVRRADDPRGTRASRRGSRRRATSGGGTRRASRRRRAARAPTRGTRASAPCRRRTAATGRGCRRACPVARSGSSASRKRRNTSPRSSRGGRSTRPRSSTGIASRRSSGSTSSFTGWRVISPNAFTCIVNPSGVRSAQPCTIDSPGSR